GVAIPWAAGVSAAYPGRALWAMVGDGGFLFHPRALGDLVERGIPAVFVVLNDASWNSIRLGQTVAFRRRYVGTDLPSIDYAQIAELYGCMGRVVEDATDLRAALSEAADWHQHAKCPLVVDVRIAAGSIPLVGATFAIDELDGVWGALWLRIV